MIISEEELSLSDIQKKLVISGWGSEVYENTIVKKIFYESDGLSVQGYFASPVNLQNKLPLIIWNRGGYGNDGKIDDFLAKGMFGEIASWGYTVLASNYREKDEFGGADVNDILNLISLADEIPVCDSFNIGMEGWSRGGMMTYKVLSISSKVKCAVIISGLADIFRNIENWRGLTVIYKKLFGNGNEEEYIKSLKERSAVNFYETINKQVHVLLIHGTKDEKISFQDSVDMYSKLISSGIDCQLRLIEEGDHYLKKNKKETSELRKNWFDSFLKRE